MRCAGVQAEAGALAAAAAAQPGTERVTHDAQHAIEQMLGADLGLPAAMTARSVVVRPAVSGAPGR